MGAVFMLTAIVLYCAGIAFGANWTPIGLWARVGVGVGVLVIGTIAGKMFGRLLARGNFNVSLRRLARELGSSN